MSNRTMLKEAIADAKTIKETAIANAKAALEESFTPHIKSMLSAKLQEMDKDEDLDEAKKDDSKDKVEEMDAPSYKRKGGESLESVPSKVGQSTVQEEEEKELDEMLAELESEIEEGKDKEKSKDELKEEEGDEDADEEIEVDVEGDDEIDLNDEEVDLEDMSEDDLKGFIEDVIKDMVDDGDLEPGDEFESEEGDEEVEVDDMEMDVDTDIEIDADELELDEAKGRSLKEGIPQESEIADYVTSMYDDSVEEREGFQSDVWTKEEYTSPTRSGGSIFIALMKHLKSVGGKDALEGNPDIHLELLSNGDIKWSADVTLNEQKEEELELDADYDKGGKYYSEDGAEAFNIQPFKMNDVKYTKHEANRMGKYIVGLEGEELKKFISDYMGAFEAGKGDTATGKTFKEDLEEDARTDAEEEGYKDGMKDEKADLKKMKVSELKAKIKEQILAELNVTASPKTLNDIIYQLLDNGHIQPETADDLLNAISNSPSDNIYEKEEVDVDIDVEDEVDVDVEADDIEIERKGTTAKVEVGLSPEEEIIQDSLKAAMDSANALGNDKLADQIGNTITFFTREYIVGDRS